MQMAVPAGKGAMAALLGADMKLAEKIISEASSVGLVEIANDNADGQIVISGIVEAVDAATQIGRQHGVRKIVKLPVSAPFHCGLMAPAAEVMAKALADTEMVDAAVPIICNVSAKPQFIAQDLRANLVAQITGQVRWRESVEFMAEQGVTRFIEFGTGKVLSTLARRAVPSATSLAVDTIDDIEKAFSI